MPPSPLLIVGVLLALIGSYFYGRGDGAELAEAQRLRDAQVARQVFDQAQAAAAGEIAKIKVTNKHITNEVRREVLHEPVYRDCVNSDVGLRGINAALANRAESASDSKLPDPDAAGRP